MRESRDGDIWVGTKDKGIFVIRHDKKQEGTNSSRYSIVSNILTSNTIYGIQFDDEGKVWCSTQDGLLNLNENGDLLQKFTTAHGLQGQDFNFGASFKDSKGRIYFGGTNGYNRFHPSKVDITEYGPRLSINVIKIIGRSSLLKKNQIDFKRIVISYFDYLITFNFSVLDFLDPERNQYRYKLENFDPDWIDNGNRNTATYTNLPPGDYIFRVQGANAAGTWNREGVSLNITVLPPPWRTWWAYCGYLVVLLAVVWTFKRVYDSYMYKLMTERLKLEESRNCPEKKGKESKSCPERKGK